MATSKRGNNEGSITQRADGRWMARLSLPGGKRKAFYGPTRADVARKLAAALRDMQHGIAVPNERLTVGQFLERYLTDVARQTVRPRTFARYAGIVRQHLVPTLGKKALARLTPADVQALLNAKLAEGLAPRSVLHIRAVLRQALGQALRWGMVSHNVATMINPPRVGRREMATLSPEQAQQLLAAVQGDRLEALYSVALALGLRQGEALGLRWRDIDLNGRVLRVRHALQRVDGALTLVEPKSATSRRTLPLPMAIVAALGAHKARQAEERRRAGTRWVEHDLVFPSTVGTPMDARNLLRQFKAHLERAGLPPIRFHDLRHSCASLLLAQRVPARVVMELLGHSQISLTLGTYSHVMPALSQEAADAMDRILGHG